MYGHKLNVLRRCGPVPGRPKPHRVVIVGPPGVGKTTLALHLIEEGGFSESYISQSNGKWWDQYVDQQAILLDEFRGWLPRQDWLKLNDVTPFYVERKGDGVHLQPKLIVTVSNYMPDTWWENMSAQWDAVTRRIDMLYVWNIITDQFDVYESDSDHIGTKNDWAFYKYTRDSGYIPMFQKMPRVE